MSYCRWSSDDFRSDLYVYEAADGFVVHVASRRYVYPDGVMPPDMDVKVGDPGWAGAWAERNMEVQKIIDTLDLEQITLEQAGESFYGLDAEEAAVKVAELRAIGFYVPKGVEESILEEADG